MPKYEAMRAAATPVTGELLKRLTLKCQENHWLKVGGIDFEDDFCLESDYPYCLERYDDVEMLYRFFEHGNWGLRAAVQYKDLIFVNQVNGGDEWWTLKIDGDDLVAFESISFRCVAHKNFSAYVERLHKATIEQCKSLTY